MEKQTVSPIDGSETLDQLLTSDVLTQDSGELSLSDSFSDSINRICEDLDGDTSTVRSRLEEDIEREELVDASLKVCRHDRIPIAGFLALRERLDITETNCIQLIPVLDQLLRGMPESSGAPDSFIPIHGDLLHLIIPVLQRGIVYAWRYDCDPCDLVKEDFEGYFDTIPSDMTLLAVYGPNWINDLREYDVGVAPTILFLRDGRVDTRLVGAFPPKALQKEIEKLRELSESA